MMAEESTRTKMIKETRVDEDQSGIKSLVKRGAEALSSFADKLGFTQEKEYEGKTKEETAVKKRAGGTVSSASKRADGIAQRGKTRGKVL